VFDKFQLKQHANKAIDKVRQAELFGAGEQKRQAVKRKRWLLLTSWVNLDASGRQLLAESFGLNCWVMKADLLSESLTRR
jgi:hypothetical protein